MPDADALDISAEIGLLWLRAHDNCALGDLRDRVWMGRDVCPVSLAAFDELQRQGLVSIVEANGEHARYVIVTTPEGMRHDASVAALTRYRRLMHGRFED